MNLMLLMDQEIYNAGAYLAPHYGVHDLTHLGQLNNYISLPDVTITTTAEYVNY